MKSYLCDDGNASISIAADSPREAAEEYVSGGDWGERKSTLWIHVWVTPEDEDGDPVEDEQDRITVTLDPVEPECGEGEAGHEWHAPLALVGGCRENPGVWGHGGGVIITEVCAHCGIYRRTDTWATDPETGRQGLECVEYRPADEDSREWVERTAEAAMAKEAE